MSRIFWSRAILALFLGLYSFDLKANPHDLIKHSNELWDSEERLRPYVNAISQIVKTFSPFAQELDGPGKIAHLSPNPLVSRTPEGLYLEVLKLPSGDNIFARFCSPLGEIDLGKVDFTAEMASILPRFLEAMKDKWIIEDVSSKIQWYKYQDGHKAQTDSAVPMNDTSPPERKQIFVVKKVGDIELPTYMEDDRYVLFNTFFCGRGNIDERFNMLRKLLNGRVCFEQY